MSPHIGSISVISFILSFEAFCLNRWPRGLLQADKLTADFVYEFDLPNFCHTRLNIRRSYQSNFNGLIPSYSHISQSFL